MRSPLKLVAALAALSLAVLGCSKKPSGGGGDQPPPEPPPSNRCEVDLGLTTTGTGASAKVIADASGLIGGEAATGRVGDFLLANDKIRAVIQKVDRHSSPLPYGGTLLDADVVRPAGETGKDAFGELGPLYQLGRTSTASTVEIVKDGSDGGPAVVAATGKDTLNDFININSVIGNYVSGLTLTVNTEAELPLKSTTYYILAPGSKRVQVVTALCNEGDKPLLLPVGDLIDTGGDVSVFNPFAKAGGFNVSYSEIADTPDFALVGEHVAYGYLPPTTQNQSLVVAGVVGTLLGSSGITDYLSTSAQPTGGLKVPAHGAASYRREIIVGHDLAEVRDEIFATRGAATKVSGTVTQGGQPVAGAKVAAVHDVTYTYKQADGSDRTETRTVTDGSFTTAADGSFSGTLPPGTYTVSAWAQGSKPTAETTLNVANDPVTQTFALEAPAKLTLKATDVKSGKPMPAKVAVLCNGACPGRNKLLRFIDTQNDYLDDDQERVVWLDARGEATISVPPGDYDILMSRGPEYSTWPDTWPKTKGTHVTLVSGNNPPVAGTLAHVVDSSGWISGDFHVHGINSPDSPVPLVQRVETFMTEGVDLLVSTDHDFVTDYAPTLAQMDTLSTAGTPKASDFIATMAGVELTTFDYGHMNAYPVLPQDDLNGGAVDWGQGEGPNMTPGQIFAALKNMPGPAGAQRVVQLNHPRGGSFFKALGIDTKTFVSHTDPTKFRMPAHAPDANGDTGLFDKNFTAMELMNNPSDTEIRELMNDWFTFLSRGHVVTGTSVSDTHTRFSWSGGYGRSFVNVGVDAPKDIQPAALATAVNAHHVVGSMGPFVTVQATNEAGDKKGIGDTLYTAGKPVKIAVTVQTPTWMSWNRIELHGYRPDTFAVNGEPSDKWPKDSDLDAAGMAFTIDLSKETPVAGVDGGQRYVITKEFTVTPTADTWYVAVVRRPASQAPLAPLVTPSHSLSMLAFTNPVFADVDGNGYDKFPMTAAAPQGSSPQPPQPFKPGPQTGTSRELDWKAKKALFEDALRETNHEIMPHK